MKPKTEEAILVKIRKLLALANDSNSPEAISAAEIAKKLIEKYSINEDQIISEVEKFVKQILIMKPTISIQELNLAIMVSDFHDCVAITSTSKSLLSVFDQQVVLVAGKVNGVEKAIKQFYWIKKALGFGFKQAVVKVKGVTSVNPHYLRSYWEGVLDSLDRRLVQQEDDTKVDIGEEDVREDQNFDFKETKSDRVPVPPVSAETSLVIREETQQESVRDWLKKAYSVKEECQPLGSERYLVDGTLYLYGRSFGRELDLSPPGEYILNELTKEAKKVSL